MQHRCPASLPEKLRSWDFLPVWMRSLAPIDRVVCVIVALLFVLALAFVIVVNLNYNTMQHRCPTSLPEKLRAICVIVALLFVLALAFVIVVNTMQHRCPASLPEKLRSWNFLPVWMRSLALFDRVVVNAGSLPAQMQPDIEIAASSLQSAEVTQATQL